MYGDHHRIFIQVMLARKVLNLAQLKEAVRVCHEKCGVPLPTSDNAEPFAEFISDINNKLSSLQLRIKGAVSEEDGSCFYALVNMRDDEVSKCANMFPGNEMQFFKKLVMKIAESDSGSLPATDVLNIVHEDSEAKLAVNVAESFLNRMVELGCLIRDGGSLSLGRLTVLEMEPYLQEQLGAELLTKCHACKQLCIKGYKCPDTDCSVKMHRHCTLQTFRSRGGIISGKCPQCQEEWEF